MRDVVLHVLPLDLERGAQTYAGQLRSALNDPTTRHEIVTLFASATSHLDAEHQVGASRKASARFGFDPRVAWRLRSVLGSVAPRAVIAHGSEPLKYVAATGWRGPLAYYKIGQANVGRAPARRALHRMLLRRPGLVVAVSDACRVEAHQEFGVPVHRLAVVPNGRDPGTYYPRDQRRPAGPVRMIFVGHLTETKRPLAFIDVLRRLHAEGLAIEGTVVGGGPMLDAARARADGVPVEVLGVRNDVPELLRQSDLLLFTSVPTGEGMPGVLIEAGMSGLPVVTTDVPGARDVITDGHTGFVVAPSDLPRLVACARRLVTDPTLRWQMGSAARIRAAQHFSMEASAAAWESLIDRLDSAAGG